MHFQVQLGNEEREIRNGAYACVRRTTAGFQRNPNPEQQGEEEGMRYG